MPKTKPTLQWSNRQRRHRLNLAFFRQKVERALQRLPSERIDRLPPALLLVFVGASESSRLHLRFLGDPTPADVLAFPHGEIVVCPAVAAALCKGHKLSFQDELLTYLLHGILHLAGYRDSHHSGALSMRRIQCRLRKLPKKIGR